MSQTSQVEMMIDNNRNAGAEQESLAVVDVLPDGQRGLLVGIMLIAFLSIDQEGPEGLLLDSDAFLERLEIAGFRVAAGDHHLLVEVPR